MTPQMMRVRAPVAWLLATVLACGLLVTAPVPPAAATHDTPRSADTEWVLRSRPRTFERDGRHYTVQLTVTQSTDQEAEFHRVTSHKVDVVLESRRDPAGPAEAVQTHEFSFWSPPSDTTFAHRRDLKSARFTDSGVFAPHRVDLAFDATGDTIATCDGHVRRRVGRLSGTLELRTGKGALGLVTELPRRAVLVHHDGACPQEYDRTCPGDALHLRAWAEGPAREYIDLAVSRVEDAPTATVEFRRVRYARPTVQSTVIATLPSSRVVIADDLATATVRGLRGTYLAGTMRAHLPGPEYTDDNNPRACGGGLRQGGHAYVETMRPGGLVDGDFRVNLWFGDRFSNTDTPLQVNGHRTMMLR